MNVQCRFQVVPRRRLEVSGALQPRDRECAHGDLCRDRVDPLAPCEFHLQVGGGERRVSLGIEAFPLALTDAEFRIGPERWRSAGRFR